MATKMEKIAQEPIKKREKKQLSVDAHFEPTKGDMLSETLDILASIICDYVDMEGGDEQKRR